VRELFAHVAEMRHLHAALIAADKLRDFLEMGPEYFARDRAASRRVAFVAPDHPSATHRHGARFRWSVVVTPVMVDRSWCALLP